jgi:hypothetical protein
VVARITSLIEDAEGASGDEKKAAIEMLDAAIAVFPDPRKRQKRAFMKRRREAREVDNVQDTYRRMLPVVRRIRKEFKTYLSVQPSITTDDIKAVLHAEPLARTDLGIKRWTPKHVHELCEENPSEWLQARIGKLTRANVGTRKVREYLARRPKKH